jgi:hypothetical protein
MIKAAQTSETLVNIYQSTWHYNPEDSHLHTQHHENLKLYTVKSAIPKGLPTAQAGL